MIRNSETSGCLKGIRVIDLTRVLAGPYCTMILADMGAEVIKVERTGLGDDSREYPPFENNRSSYFGDLNRNKKSIDLNLKKDCDKSILTKLIASADACFTAMTPERSYADAEAAKIMIDYGVEITTLPEQDLQKLEAIRDEVLHGLADENPTFAMVIKSQSDFMKSYAHYRDMLGIYGWGNTWTFDADK